MKKVLPLLLGFFFLTPFNNIFAFTPGYFDDNEPISGSPGSHNNLFDNDLDTGISIPGYGAVTLIVDLDYDLEITDFYYSGIQNNLVTISFIDNLGNSVKSYIARDIDNGWNNVLPSIVGIKKITITNRASGIYTISEFDIRVAEKPVVISPVSNLTAITNYNSTNLSWKNPENEAFKNIIIKQNGIEVAELGVVQGYSITGLNPETTYNFEVIVKYTDGTLSDGEKITITTDKEPEDTLAPGEISGLSASVTSFDATFAWVNPTDTDFKHVRIYRDGELIEPSHTSNTYNATGLVANKTYVFKFVTVDSDGNNSAGYIQTIKTNPEVDSVAPDAVTGINIYNGNKSGSVKWSGNKEDDLSFYNVYVNGVKHNESPILSTNYVINNIENDETYEINVTAVDTSDNESEFSASYFLTPEEGAMPVFKASYDLKSVSDGTGNWFTTMWPILAFAVGLPLAFIVATRMKTLFFA